jgi:cell division protein FtsW (lipid II flippase)
MIQTRLLWLAAAFLFLYSLAFTLAPAVRLHAFSPLNYLHWAGYLSWLVGFTLLNRQMSRSASPADPYLLPIAALLTGWGLLTIWRLDATMGARQTIWFGIAVLILRVGLRKPSFLEWLRNYKYIWLSLGLLITAATFFFGTYPGGEGPHLWLGCCGIYLQPSEPIKLLLIIYLAAYLADRLPSSISLYGLLAPTMAVVAAAMGLLLAQRDMGTALLFISIYSFTVYIASGRRRMILLSVAGLLTATLVGYQMIPVVRARIDSWLNPWQDTSGHSYQIIQSLIAFAAGGIFGQGPGLGSPGLVPVAHSDFIFAAIAEEGGMLAVFAILMLYGIFIIRALKIAVSAPVRFQRYLAAGLSAYMAVQTILIMGGTLLLLPLTGVTLPFVSYGGSSLVTTMTGLLILMACCAEPEEEPAPLLRDKPYQLVSAAFLAGLLAVGTLAGWWSTFERDNLLNRNDNSRISIADRYIPRGAMFDRSNQPLVVSSGAPGSLVRSYLYSPLSLVTGYNDSLYGLSGLEKSLGPYLRGLKGNPASTIWWHQLIYSQPPQGLDVRLSIDLDLQKRADDLLGSHHGAVVLLNARTGEILAMASHPGYDANSLAQNWDALITSSDSPLFNRATQAQYQPGPVLGPLMMAWAINHAALPDLPTVLNYTTPAGYQLECSQPLSATPTWGEAVRFGCPNALITLSKPFLTGQLDELFNQVGLYSSPDLQLPVAQHSAPQKVYSVYQASIGMDTLTVSPLQMAIAASALSSGGTIPHPVLAMAVHTPTQGWIILPGSTPQTALPETPASLSANLLAEPGQFYWRTLAVANGASPISWYLAGTISRWQGSPLVIAVALEENNPILAEKIGKGVMESALK